MGRLPWIFALALSLALSLAAAWLLPRVEIESGIVDLLPAGRPAADEYRLLIEEFGNLEQVYAVVTLVEADDDLLPEAASLLAEHLEASPFVADAAAGLEDEDLAFLRQEALPRAPLVVPQDALEAALEAETIALRVAELRRRLRSPAGAFAADLAVADPLGLAAALRPSGASLVDPWSGAFLSRDGRSALVIITPGKTGGEISIGALGRALLAALEEARTAVSQELGREVRLEAVGGPLYAAQDEALFRRNLGTTLGASGLGVALCLLLFFRGPAAPLAVLLAVATGVLWTGGWIALRGVPLSALAVSFGAILLGLGVDYGIHVASRYRHRRLEGEAPSRALLTAWRDTGGAIVTSAVTTAGAFAALGRGHFRPVQELGSLVMVGIGAILLATVAVGGAWLVLTTGDETPRRKGSLWRLLGSLAEGAARLGRRRRRWVWMVAGLASLASVVALGQLRFSGDLRALRPADHPALAAERTLTETFDLGLDHSTAVVTAPDLAAALQRAVVLEAELVDLGAEVTSPAALLAERPGRRQALRGEAAAAAARALRRALADEGLAEAAFARSLAVLDSLAAGSGPAPLTVADLPVGWRRQIRQVEDAGEGRTRLAVSFAMPLGSWPEGPPPAALERLRSIDPDLAVASVPRLGREVKDLLAQDLRSLGGWSLALVAGIVLVSFRGRPGDALLALLPVSCGLLWTLGLGAALGLALDPFSLLVAPLLLGIGIDDGLHAVHGRRRHGSLAASVAVSGRAMALTTLTTALGFGSLALSQVPALRNGGLLVAIGTGLCLLATLVLLPACEGRE